MGLDYALVHSKYTIPVAIVLTLVYRPLLTRLDVYKVGFLITVAVTATIPWDSYLIRTRIWTYPSSAVVGLTLFDIPAEELFFFVIQTYNTAMLYLLLSKPTFHPMYLRAERQPKDPEGAANPQWRYYRVAGQLLLVFIAMAGFNMVRNGEHAMYMGLIIIWAVPVLLFLWSVAYQFILGLPLSNTLVPILLPTAYLWIVDTLALRRGTWVIETGTKLNWQLWEGLEIEEAVFFLLTNTLIVTGLVTFDFAVAVLNSFPEFFPDIAASPPGWILVTVGPKALFKPASEYNGERIKGLQEAVGRLRRKSRSFYLASGAFPGRLRIDMIILYSFCRVADDLVDNAASISEAKSWVSKLCRFLDISYGSSKDETSVSDYVTSNFPADTQLALLQLPTAYLSSQPMYDLLKGFEMDLAFATDGDSAKGSYSSPIKTESDLDVYAARVAGTVAESCLELVFRHVPNSLPEATKQSLVHAGGRMGIALQYVNIARDIAVDARIPRVYIPLSWLDEEGLTLASVIKSPQGSRIEKLRSRLLDKAFSIYGEARGAIEQLPVEARGPMRVAVESYMEIGRVLRTEGYRVKAGRATVPKTRRIRVAWGALNQG